MSIFDSILFTNEVIIPTIIIIVFSYLFVIIRWKKTPGSTNGQLIFPLIIMTVLWAVVIATAFMFIRGDSALGIIGVIISVSIIVLLILGNVILRAIRKKLLRRANVNIVKARLVGAIFQKQSKIEVTAGNKGKTIEKKFYSLIFEYEEFGRMKECTTIDYYKPGQIAYLIELNREISICVRKNYCQINMITEIPEIEYDNTTFKNFKMIESWKGPKNSFDEYDFFTWEFD